MTSSKAKLSDLLKQNDFAELAAQQKRHALQLKQEEAERIKHEEEEKKELARIAALPKITEEDLKKAEEAGYERGIIEGKEQAEITLNAEFESNLGKMQKSLSHLPSILGTEVAHIQKQSLKFIKVILEKILRDASDKYSEKILSFMLNEALEHIPEDAKLLVKLSPADRFFLQEKGGKTLTNEHIKYIEDESIAKGGCVIEWQNGGVDARFNGLITEIDKLIQAAHDQIEPENIELQYKKEAETNDNIDNKTQSDETNEKTIINNSSAEDKSETIEMDNSIKSKENIETSIETSAVETIPEAEKAHAETTSNSSEDVTTGVENAPS